MIQAPRHQNKKLRNLLAVVLSLVSSTAVAQGWQVVNFPTQDNINGIAFTSPDTGYVVTSSGKVARTTDAGKTWGGVQVTKHSLEDIYFATPKRVYVCGAKGTVITSTDAGRNWLDHSVQDTSITLVSIRCIGTGLLLATGLTPDSTRQNIGVCLRSEDDGRTWARAEITGLGFGEILLTSDNKTRLLSWGNMFTSADLGASWQTTKLPDGKPGRTLDIKGNTAIMVGNYAQLARSDDRGKTWTEIAIPKEDAHFTSVLLLDNQRAYIAGYNSRVYYTSDGGRTWTRETLPLNCEIFALTKAGNRLWAVGNRGTMLWKSLK